MNSGSPVPLLPHRPASGSKRALAEAVIKLYKIPKEEREALGRLGRKYVEEHHAILLLAERLLQCIGKG